MKPLFEAVLTMESSEQARDIYGRCRTTDESYVVGSNADHCKSVRDSRMPNLNSTYEAGVPFKAQPCCDFRTRGCGYGTACRYSHEFRGTNQGETVVKDIKVGSCKWYAKGKQCPYGNNCRFPHEDVKNDTGEFRDSHAISIVAAGDKQDSSLEQDNRLVGLSSGAKQDNRPVDVSLRANRENQRSVYWKTKLCNRWETVKECLYGSNCSYAHGLAGI